MAGDFEVADEAEDGDMAVMAAVIDRYAARARGRAWPTTHDPVALDARNYFNNLDLLSLFNEATELDLSEIARRALDLRFHPSHAGEVVEEACRFGILEQISPARWRLLDREPAWALFGSEGAYAVRIRGLTGQAGAEAARLWKREMGRRQRAEAKQLKKLLRAISNIMEYIIDLAPETRLTPELSRFAVGSVNTVVGVRQLVLDSVASMSVSEAREIKDLFDAICTSVNEAHSARLKAVSSDEHVISDDDLEDLSKAFSLPI